jgi:hypothetical protein
MHNWSHLQIYELWHGKGSTTLPAFPSACSVLVLPITFHQVWTSDINLSKLPWLDVASARVS